MFTDNAAEAAAHPADVTRLAVDEHWDQPWQDLIPSLTALQRLRIGPRTDLDPAGVTAWPSTLRELSLVLPDGDPTALLAAWVTAVPQLAKLTLWTGALPSPELPAVLAELPHLATLVVKADSPVELPASLGGTLKALELHLPPGAPPTSLLRLTGLEELRLGQQIEALPDAFAELTALRSLDLSWSLNKGSMSAEDHPASHFRPMPAVIAKLPALQSLTLDMCGIFERDLATLAGHPRLAALSLAFSGVADLRPVRDLPALRALNLKASYRLRDLSPLAGLPLTRLGLEACNRIRDLGPLLELPALEQLDIARCDEAPLSPVLLHPTLTAIEGSDEQRAAFARRGELAGVTPEGIRAGLASADPAAAAAALDQLASWVTLTSAADCNGLIDLLQLGDDADDADVPVDIPLLSAALAAPGLDPAIAARVFAACFRSVGDNFAPALQAADIVIDHGSLADQQAIADAVLYARRNYDAGHRMWEANVHETMLDVRLTKLGAPAIAHLLDGLSDDDISSDAVEDLFVAAYARADDATTARLDARLRGYVEEQREYKDAEDNIDLLGKIAAAQPDAEERLADLLPSQQGVSWSGRLSGVTGPSDAIEALTALVDAVDAGTLSMDEVKPLYNPFKEATAKAALIKPALARRLLKLAIAVGYDDWIDSNVLYPLVRSDLDWLASQDDKLRRIVSKRLAPMQRHATRSDGERLLAARARLEGLDPAELRRKAVVEEIDRSLRREPAEAFAAFVAFGEDPFPLDMNGKRTKNLARALDQLRFTGLPDDTTDLMQELFNLREHLDWSPENQQYVLTYLLPLAAEEGPDFFDEVVQPWLDDQEIVEPRFAYNLACYQAQHGDTAALCAAIERALALGKPREQFLDDSDFAGRLDEPEVQRILADAPKPLRYYAMSRVSYYNAPCRFVDKGWKPDRPFWWKHRWTEGQPLQGEPDLPLRFPLKPFKEHASEMSRDLPLIDLRKVPLMHEGIVEVLEAHGARLEKFPAVFVDPDDGSEHGGYYAVNLLGVIKPEALGRFHGRVSDLGHVDGSGISDEKQVQEPIDGLVCAWIDDTSTLVVFEPLRDALQAAGFTELQFNDLGEIAM